MKAIPEAEDWTVVTALHHDDVQFQDESIDFDALSARARAEIAALDPADAIVGHLDFPVLNRKFGLPPRDHCRRACPHPRHRGSAPLARIWQPTNGRPAPDLSHRVRRGIDRRRSGKYKTRYCPEAKEKDPSVCAGFRSLQESVALTEGLPDPYRKMVGDLATSLSQDSVASRATDELHDLLDRITAYWDEASRQDRLELEGNVSVRSDRVV